MRRRQSTVHAAVRLLLAGTLAALALAPATALAAGSEGTVLICEATGNPSAPYVEIRVEQSALGDYSTAQGDLIPAPAGGCPASVSGAAAPVETGTATTSATLTTTATASAVASPPAPPATIRHHPHARSGSGVQGSSSNGGKPLPTGPPLTPRNPLQRRAAAPMPPPPLHELPRTGGDVPLTVLIGLALLVGGALLPAVRRRSHTHA